MKHCRITVGGNPDPDDADDALCRARAIMLYPGELGRSSFANEHYANIWSGSPDPDDADAQCLAGPNKTYLL